VLSVVEALERQRALDEVGQAVEALLAEEALLECVVEVLDRAIAPGFPRRDEHERDPLVQADPDDLAQAGRRDERAAVIQLQASWQPVALPEGVKRRQHALITSVGDDLDPGVMGGHVDLGERMEAHPAVQMARGPTRSAWTTSPARLAAGAG
jgi:hypothetical protein